MKVSELIKELKKYDQDAKVILQKDSEGNEYSPLDEIGEGAYFPEKPWYGEFYPNMRPSRDSDGVHAVVLAPVN